jgi:hypothetical protein
MAEASGLKHVRAKNNIRQAHTQGTGELIRAALDAGCRTLLIGVGGTACSEGGAGALQALGIKYFDADHRELPPTPESLISLHSLSRTGLDPRLSRTQIFVLCDVKNPLLGPRGSARTYGPQKGASPADVVFLEKDLKAENGFEKLKDSFDSVIFSSFLHEVNEVTDQEKIVANTSKLAVGVSLAMLLLAGAAIKQDGNAFYTRNLAELRKSNPELVTSGDRAFATKAARGGVGERGSGGEFKFGGAEEVKLGDLAKKTMTTTAVEFSPVKIASFETAVKSAVSNASPGEVLATTTTLKDAVARIKDEKQRQAAVRGLYALGSTDHQTELKQVLGKLTSKDKQAEVVQQLVQVGQSVKPETLKVEPEKRKVDDMVKEVQGMKNEVPEKYVQAHAEFAKKHNGDKILRWAPLVLESYSELYPTDQPDVKQRLEAALFDTASTLARIKAESDGNPTSVSSKKAMGLTQVIDSTVERYCPNMSLSDPKVQIECGMAESLGKSNKFEGNAVNAHIAYVAGPERLKNYQKAAGSTDPEKVMEWLAKGGPYGDKDASSLNKDELAEKKKYQDIPAYVSKNLSLPEALIKDHGWFNELLQDQNFKFLWADLEGDLPEFGLHGAAKKPEVKKAPLVAQTETASPAPAKVAKKVVKPVQAPPPTVKTATAPKVETLEDEPQVQLEVEEAGEEKPPEAGAAKSEAPTTPNEVIKTTELRKLGEQGNDLYLRAGVNKLLSGARIQEVKAMEELATTNPDEARKKLIELGKSA